MPVTAPLPYRGRFGDPRPSGLPPLPPAPLPGRHGRRPLKAWRWVGCFGPELMVCLAEVRVGPFHRTLAAVYDRVDNTLHRPRSPQVQLGVGQARLTAADLELSLTFTEASGIETVSRMDDAYAWTRKQAGLPAHGEWLDPHGRARRFAGAVIIDDSAGYHPRRTRWRWCAGVGRAIDGRPLAWNLVEGLHDAPVGSERTLWVDGAAAELAPTPIAADLSGAGTLRFAAEAEQSHREERLVLAARYRQPFGTFSGSVGGIELAHGYGVMEEHAARW